MKVILVDSMHLCYRAHFTHLDLFSSEAEPTGVLHGVLNSILSLQSRFPDASMVFCWDQGQSWRKKVSPIYKSRRETTENTKRVYGQIDILQEMLDSIGFKQVSVDTIEGDDVIGILSRELSKDVNIDEIYVYSGDKDFYQLLGGKIKIIKASGVSVEVLDEKFVVKKYGITPQSWTRMRALSGDSSDDMKAVKGIGPATAVTLLAFGIDPSLPYMREDLRKRLSKKYIELVKRWQLVHLFYQLSELPKTTDDLVHISKGVREELYEQIRTVLFQPTRTSKPGMGKKFREALGKYELQYIFDRRQQFWKIP